MATLITSANNETWQLRQLCSHERDANESCDIREMDHYGQPTGEILCHSHGEWLGVILR